MGTSLLPASTPTSPRRLRRSYKTSGTLTVPTDVYLLDLLLVSGGGGGGGGINASGAVGGGGGSGWPIRCQLPVTPGDVVAITIGAGGIGGVGLAGSSGNGSAGTNGGDTVVTVNGVEAIRIPGGGAGGGCGTVNSPTATYGRSSFGTYGSSGSGANPFGGGGGAGYCGGLSGVRWSSVQSHLANSAGGYDRIRGGRRPLDLYSDAQGQGATNGWVPAFNMVVSSAGNELPILVPERFLHVCWGGTVATDGLAPAAQPANSGHGGTGAGQGASAAANTGGNGGSGFALVEWEAVA